MYVTGAYCVLPESPAAVIASACFSSLCETQRDTIEKHPFRHVKQSKHPRATRRCIMLACFLRAQHSALSAVYIFCTMHIHIIHEYTYLPLCGSSVMMEAKKVGWSGRPIIHPGAFAHEQQFLCGMPYGWFRSRAWPVGVTPSSDWASACCPTRFAMPLTWRENTLTIMKKTERRAANSFSPPTT